MARKQKVQVTAALAFGEAEGPKACGFCLIHHYMHLRLQAAGGARMAKHGSLHKNQGSLSNLVNPACSKSLSKARASRILNSLIMLKLAQSVMLHFLSSRAE